MPSATAECCERRIAVDINPPLHDGQKRILRERKRFNVASCGRRFGKSQLSQILLLEGAADGWPVGYFAPAYKFLEATYDEMEARFAPVTARANKTNRKITLATGGVIECWTQQDPDAGRSRKYARVVIDEAGLVPDLGDTWQHAIRPTLADLRGDAYFLSTPKGRNYFWQAWQRGLIDPSWACWQMPTSANPHISPDEIEAMRQSMSERAFRQEVMAEFLDDAGGVFRRIREAATAAPQDKAVPGRAYAIGVDWGRQNDATVFTVVDSSDSSVAAVDRMTSTEYALQKGRLAALWERFGKPVILAEENSMGGPVIEELRRSGMTIQPFTTSNASKAEIVDHLALAFERGLIRLPAGNEALIGELEAFESTRLPSGLMRYGAPEGMHDDMVVSLCLAWWAATNKPKPWSQGAWG